MSCDHTSSTLCLGAPSKTGVTKDHWLQYSSLHVADSQPQAPKRRSCACSAQDPCGLQPAAAVPSAAGQLEPSSATSAWPDLEIGSGLHIAPSARDIVVQSRPDVRLQRQAAFTPPSSLSGFSSDKDDDDADWSARTYGDGRSTTSAQLERTGAHWVVHASFARNANTTAVDSCIAADSSADSEGASVAEVDNDTDNAPDSVGDYEVARTAQPVGEGVSRPGSARCSSFNGGAAQSDLYPRPPLPPSCRRMASGWTLLPNQQTFRRLDVDAATLRLESDLERWLTPLLLRRRQPQGRVLCMAGGMDGVAQADKAHALLQQLDLAGEIRPRLVPPRYPDQSDEGFTYYASAGGSECDVGLTMPQFAVLLCDLGELVRSQLQWRCHVTLLRSNEHRNRRLVSFLVCYSCCQSCVCAWIEAIACARRMRSHRSGWYSTRPASLPVP